MQGDLAARVAELEAENEALEERVQALTSCLRIVEGAVVAALDR